MKTYFARHSGNLDIEDQTIASLRKDHLVAIHYPWDRQSQDGDSDSISLNPDDYKSKAKGALRALVEASTDGGYVFATYRGQPKALLGRIDPGTPIELLHTRWNSDHNRPAVLKTLRLVDCQELSVAHEARLSAFAPQQSTFTRWHGVGDQVERALLGTTPKPSLSTLTTTQQEIMCSEYLRIHDKDMPTLQTLLMPIGRTMKDFDIVGVATDGRPLLAQVTFGDDANKLAIFLSKDDGSSHMVYFCGEQEPRTVRNTWVIPLSDVYNAFASSPEGKAWLKVLQEPA